MKFAKKIITDRKIHPFRCVGGSVGVGVTVFLPLVTVRDETSTDFDTGGVNGGL